MNQPYVGARPVIVYVYRGPVERAYAREEGRHGIAWRDGYSEAGINGAVTFPWMTYRECQADARSRGAVARFTKKVSS